MYSLIFFEKIKRNNKEGVKPKALLKSEKEILKVATKYTETFQDIPYVFNLGHGLLPETDPDKVQCLINFYRNF